MSSCKLPFLLEDGYQAPSGGLHGRICSNATGPSCCLPCPAFRYIYSSTFQQKLRGANCIAVLSLVLEIILLAASFATDHDPGNFLSIGLATSLLLVATAFTIPLGTAPQFCRDAITPNDSTTNGSCKATGVLIVVGAMGTVVWTLLRTTWIAFIAVGKLDSKPKFRKFEMYAAPLGIVLPFVFIATTLPVSYRLGNVCAPGGPPALLSWFGWVLALAGMSNLIQLVLLVHLCWPQRSEDTGTQGSRMDFTPNSKWKSIVNQMRPRWRDILSCLLIANLSSFFGVVYIPSLFVDPARQQQQLVDAIMTSDTSVLTGDVQLGVSEAQTLAAVYLVSFLGIIIFFIKFQRAHLQALSDMIGIMKRKIVMVLHGVDADETPCQMITSI